MRGRHLLPDGGLLRIVAAGFNLRRCMILEASRERR